jgi:hypothetical protein
MCVDSRVPESIGLRTGLTSIDLPTAASGVGEEKYKSHRCVRDSVG